MPLVRLEHVNIRTHRLALLRQWYQDVLGLVDGERPPFDSVGSWLYLGEMPIVHLVAADTEHQGLDPKLEHFALSATDLAGFLATLKTHNISYRPDRVPELRILQINIRDPDGNALHIDFPAEEADALGFD